MIQGVEFYCCTTDTAGLSMALSSYSVDNLRQELLETEVDKAITEGRFATAVTFTQRSFRGEFAVQTKCGCGRRQGGLDDSEEDLSRGAPDQLNVHPPGVRRL